MTHHRRGALLAAATFAAAFAASTPASAAINPNSPTALSGTTSQPSFAQATDEFSAPATGAGYARWKEVVSATIQLRPSGTPLATALVSGRGPGGLRPSTQGISARILLPRSSNAGTFTLTAQVRSCSQLVVRSGSSLLAVGSASCGAAAPEVRTGTLDVIAPPLNSSGPLTVPDQDVRVGQSLSPPVARYHVGTASLGGGPTFPDVNVVSAQMQWGDGQLETLYDFGTGDPADGIHPGSDIETFKMYEDVVRTHSYAAPGTYTIEAAVAIGNQSGGGSTVQPTEYRSARALVRVREAPRVRAAAITATEGAPFTGRIADVQQVCPGCTYEATVDWGDGTVEAATAEQVTADHHQFNGTHAYDEQGQYTTTIKVRVLNEDGDLLDQQTVTGTATVDDAPLFASTGLSIHHPYAFMEFTGQIGHLTDANPLARASDYQVIVDWGDGRTSLGSVAADPLGGFTVSGRHVFPGNGSYLVRFKVRSTRGQEAEGNATVQVGFD